MKRDVTALISSDHTTAEVAKNMSPFRVRTYLIIRISRAFCSVSKTKLTYLRNSGVFKTKTDLKTNIKTLIHL